MSNSEITQIAKQIINIRFSDNPDKAKEQLKWMINAISDIVAQRVIDQIPNLADKMEQLDLNKRLITMENILSKVSIQQKEMFNLSQILHMKMNEYSDKHSENDETKIYQEHLREKLKDQRRMDKLEKLIEIQKVRDKEFFNNESIE